MQAVYLLWGRDGGIYSTNLQITHLRGSILAWTADWIVFTKHRRQTTRCPQGDVSIVARALKIGELFHSMLDK